MPDALPEVPQQLLPIDAYTSEDWFEAEQKLLFGNSWTYAGVTTDFQTTGDYATLYAGHHPLAVLRNGNGELTAFHNICRHRGTEILEGAGNAGQALTCPYHKWTYGLDGTLRGIPNRAECFPDFDMNGHALHAAAIGIFNGMVFVHPDPAAAETFDDWLCDLPDYAWPHDIADLEGGEIITYEMNCNWKIYFENAVDGYHLAYLHENTLGGPIPSRNTWDAHGPHLVWYSTEENGQKTSMTQYMTQGIAPRQLAKVAGAEDGTYGGVYMLFPTTVMSPKPYGLYISQLVPMKPDLSLLHTQVFRHPGETSDWLAQEWSAAVSAQDERSGRVKLELLDCHPLESGAFRLEDIWICEKIQRAMRSPKFSIGALARGAGAEAPIGHFQRTLLNTMQASKQQTSAGVECRDKGGD